VVVDYKYQRRFAPTEWKVSPESVESFRGIPRKAWTSKEAAEELLNAIRYEIRTKTHDPEKYKPENKNRYSITNVISSYLESREQDVQHDRLGKHQLHEITRHIETLFRPYMLEKEHFRDVREIKLYHLERLNNNGLPKWKGKSVKNFWTSINTFLNWCERMQLIQHPGMPNLPEVVGKPIKWLTDEEQEKVLAKIPERHKPIFQFLCYYGCRPSEAIALQVQDVQENIVMIQRAFNRSGEMDTTKTGKIRTLPIIPETAPLIKTALSGKIGGQTPLFINPDTGGFYNYQALRWQWDVVRKELGIDRTLTEGTRKTVATSAINAGETPANIAGMLGNSPEVLKRHYAQVQAPLFAGVVKRRRFQSVSKTKIEDGTS
jgi:integrase